MPDPSLRIQVLKRSRHYRVRRAFVDFYNNRFLEGEILTFVTYQFLPYHGGYTVMFREKTLYLQEESNAEILNALGSYLVEIGE
jgi:hypothetical protein